VLIVGGGVVGSACAKLLEERCGRSLSIGLLEQSPSLQLLDSGGIPNPRSYALSPKSMDLLKVDTSIPNKLGNYKTMQVWQQNAPWTLVFTSDDLPEHHDRLGACVEDSVLVNLLYNSLETTSVYRGEIVKDLHQDTNTRRVSLSTTSHEFTTSLLIAADGGNSWVRQKLGIPWLGWDYGRTALTFTVELQHTTGMPPRAFQRFLPNGPIALLPTYSQKHAVVVWSTTPAQARQYQEASPDELVAQLNTLLQVGPQRPAPIVESTTSSSLLNHVLYGIERLVDTVHFGLALRQWNDMERGFQVPPIVTALASQRVTFPLSCRHVSSYTNDRVALVGDAAHTVHPMAGQGLNLGLDDVDVLTRTIQKAHASGMDLATFLDEYHGARRAEVQLKLSGIHMLHELLGNQQSTLLQHANSMGMQVANQVSPIRRQLVAMAAGL
jgi:ubiquinone biosynthesis monooxygenase Coq6